MAKRLNPATILIVVVVALLVFQSRVLTVSQATPVLMYIPPYGCISSSPLYPDCITATTRLTASLPSSTQSSVSAPSGKMQVANYYQQWIDVLTGRVLYSSLSSQITLALPGSVASQIAAFDQKGDKAIMVKVTNAVTYPIEKDSGYLIQQGNLGKAACLAGSSYGSLSASSLLCWFSVLQFNPTVTARINGKVASVASSGPLGSAYFSSLTDTAGSTKAVNFLVMLQGSSSTTEMMSVATSILSPYGYQLEGNYLDLRSALSSYQTTPFTLSLDVFEHWNYYRLDYSAMVGYIAGSALFQYLVQQYLISSTDVTNEGQASYVLSTTYSSGLTGIPAGTPTLTVPTATCGGTGQPVCYAPPTTAQTCITNGGVVQCFGLTGSGVSSTTPGVPTLPPISGGISCASWLPASLNWVCDTTFGVPNWIWIIAIVGILLLVWGSRSGNGLNFTFMFRRSDVEE